MTAPKLLWHIEGGVTAGFDELGETWSTPSLSKIRESDGTLTDVLVFGGGYDDDRYDLDADDPDDGVSIGRAVYVVEALTGTRRWAIGPAGTAETYDLELASLEDSIPGEVRILDLYDDGVMDRLYFADIRGRIFRADFSNTATATSYYGGGLIASLTDTSSCNWMASPNSCRLFYNSLDVAVMTGFPVAPYIQLAMGSGFRAHPKNLQTQDRFYVVYGCFSNSPPFDGKDFQRGARCVPASAQALVLQPSPSWHRAGVGFVSPFGSSTWAKTERRNEIWKSTQTYIYTSRSSAAATQTQSSGR